VRVQLAGWLSPWREVVRHPGPLMRWAVITLVLGSMGFWLAPLLRTEAWITLASLTSLGTFGVVLLAETYAGSELTAVPSALQSAQGGRSVAQSLVFLLVVVQAALVMRVRQLQAASALTTWDLSLQLGLTVGSIAVAIYLLCFRLGDLEPSVSAVKAREDTTVDRLAQTASRTSVTPDGEAL